MDPLFTAEDTDGLINVKGRNPLLSSGLISFMHATDISKGGYFG